MPGEPVFSQRRLTVVQPHRDGGDDVRLHVIGELRQIHVVRVLTDGHPGRLHHPPEIVTDLYLRC